MLPEGGPIPGVVTLTATPNIAKAAQHYHPRRVTFPPPNQRGTGEGLDMLEPLQPVRLYPNRVELDMMLDVGMMNERL